jgi:hypothetical protein
VAVWPDLFGRVLLARQWGCIGAPDRVRLEPVPGPRRCLMGMPRKAVTRHSVMPWLLSRDYAEHRVLDETLPDSFEEWEASARTAAWPSYATQRVVVLAGEFSRWCIATRQRPNATARAAFARKAASRPFPPK